MKAKSSAVFSCPFVPGATKPVAKLLGMVAALSVLVSFNGAVQGVTLISKAPNAAVYIGLPFTTLEFENPLAGTETVVGYAVLDWRDADYSAGPPRSYDDWTVSNTNQIDGNVNEIWMRQNGHWIQTTTTVPSRIISIHLVGDNNDGLAQVMVDGVEVARLDMNTQGTAETALVLVKGLANTTHTITVNDLGVGPSGLGDDVATMGAAALNENPLKWSQPPVPGPATNVFHGWNEKSLYQLGPIAADDWVCTNINPVTDIHWWGSFIGWEEPVPPPQVPIAFVISIWTDVPAQTGGFSHPGTNIWQVYCTNFTWHFVGWDEDPRNPGPLEACFKFEQDLLEHEWFYQNPDGLTNIYWLSIAAVYPTGQPVQYPWGWKTRPRDPDSLAPDDAVRIFDPTAPVVGSVFQAGEPIEFPAGVSWDLAFELTTRETEEGLDFGDAPDSTAAPQYPTYLINNGARHVIGPLFMGAVVDAETDGQPSANADGDDLNPAVGPDDEDGVVFNTALIANVPSTVDVTCSSTGLLQAWIDFNMDGDWADANEQIITNYPVVAGLNTIPFSVPGMGTGQTYARFRLSTVAGLSYVGAAPDGEVEDYTIFIDSLKWLQQPDLSETGVDVDNEVWLADDFLCTQTGPITDIHLWASFYEDQLPPGGLTNLSFTLVIYSDVPTNATNPYSHPGDPLCTMTFGPGQYQAGLCAFIPPGEWWHTPPQFWQPAADFNCYQFDFYLDPTNACWQTNGNIYWLAVKYQDQSGTGVRFGWKSSYEQWNDDAVWLDTTVTPPVWRPLVYGGGHPFAPRSLDLAFALSGELEEATLDFGDAPDAAVASIYPTLLVNNGARHVVVPTVFLGNLIDAEADGQPNTAATGDDLGPPLADEDGVVFNTPLVPGQVATVTVTASIGGAFLNAWIDFGANNSWAEAGDQIFTNVVLNAGPNPLNFLVPATATGSTNTYARFRFSTMPNLTYTGPAPNGEVEDYWVRIQPLLQPESDLGDAPDDSNTWGMPMTAYPPGGPPGVLAKYPTVYLAGSPPFGPIHALPLAVAHLGPAVSLEGEADIGPDTDPVNNIRPAIDLPDQDGFDDSVQMPLVLPHCLPTAFNYTVNVLTPGSNMFVNVWFDWNRDGDWNDSFTCPDGTVVNEWAVQNQLLTLNTPGLVNMTTPQFPAWHPVTTNTPLWMRITLAESAWPPPGGPAPTGGEGPAAGYQFGETEDYYITEYETTHGLDFGDAPDPTYPTLLASNGARHSIIPGFRLGILEDAELDGQPNATATGDDLSNQADEDGVVFTTPVLVGTQACVNVTLTAFPPGGRLDAWVDFNGNGLWDGTEQVFTNLLLAPGVNPGLCFTVPGSARLGTNYARFRLSSLGGLSPDGPAPDGEVEDYQVILRQRAPSTNIIITWIGVTNIATNQVITVEWNAETGVQYQLQATTTLSNAPSLIWTDVGPVVIGPVNQQSETNSPLSERYYRVVAPWVWP